MSSGVLSKIENKNWLIFIASQITSRMNKNSRNTPRNTSGLVDEINVDNYPYYRFIPIDHIGEKQQRMIDRYRIAQKVKEPSYTYEEPPARYEEPIPHNLPILDLVPTDKPNTYQVDFKNLEDKVREMRETIDSNSYLIEQQSQEIASNKSIIEEQVQQLQTQAVTIQNNGAYIQQQLHCYSHNNSVINNQCYYVQQQNAEIASKQEQLNSLQSQKDDIEQEIKNLQADIESYQGQLNYHASMLSSFNTLLQNPGYFSQLMMAAMNASQSPTE